MLNKSRRLDKSKHIEYLLVDIYLINADFRILPEFLNSEKTQTVVVCNSGRIGKIVDDMKTMFGLEFQLYDKYENTFLNFE